MLRAQHTTVATSRYNGGQLRSRYLKKCKHFIMVVNYVREQLELGLIQVIKIKGELNNADLHTKKLRDKSFCNESRQHPRLSSEA